MCVLMLKISHRPDGKNADTLASILACKTAADAPVNYTRRLYVPQIPSMFHIAPMGDSCFAHFLQGGGVYVNGGSVTFSSCTITGNSAGYVRVHAQKFPSPSWGEEIHVPTLHGGDHCDLAFPTPCPGV